LLARATEPAAAIEALEGAYLIEVTERQA